MVSWNVVADFLPVSWGRYQRNYFLAKDVFQKRNCHFLVMRNGKLLWWRSYTYQRISFRFPDTDDISFDVKWCSLYQILQTYQTFINFQITFLESTNTYHIIKGLCAWFFYVKLQQSNTESMQVAKL